MNKHYPFILSITVCSLALVMALKLENIKEYRMEIKSLKELFEEFLNNARGGISLIFKAKRLRWLIIYSSVIGFALVAILQTYQLFFLNRKIPIKYFGIIYFLLYMTSSISSKVAHHFKRFNGYKMFMLFLFMLFLTPLLMLIPAKMFIIIIIVPRIVIGIYPSIAKEYINKEIEIDRATIFSLRSLFAKIPQVVLLPYIGYLIDNKGLNYSLIIVAVIIFILGMILLASQYFIKKS